MSAASIVPLLWVTMMICVDSASSRSNVVKRRVLASSRAASNSSKTQNGLGWTRSMEKSSASATRTRSPPERAASDRGGLPGSRTTTSRPGSASEGPDKEPPTPLFARGEGPAEAHGEDAVEPLQQFVQCGARRLDVFHLARDLVDPRGHFGLVVRSPPARGRRRG